MANQNVDPIASLRYSDEKLEMFKGIIVAKKKTAESDLRFLRDELNNSSGETLDTSPTFRNIPEEARNAMSRQETENQIKRQVEFIEHLDAALVRVENKTYGICQDTGRLIPEVRLRAVPSTTRSIEAKNNAYPNKGRFSHN